MGVFVIWGFSQLYEDDDYDEDDDDPPFVKWR